MTQIVPVESARNYQRMKNMQKEWEDQYKVDRTFNEWLNANNTLKFVDSFFKAKEFTDPNGPTEDELEQQFTQNIDMYTKRLGTHPAQCEKIIKYLKLIKASN